jgi:hypothetical protein
LKKLSRTRPLRSVPSGVPCAPPVLLGNASPSSQQRDDDYGMCRHRFSSPTSWRRFLDQEPRNARPRAQCVFPSRIETRRSEQGDARPCFRHGSRSASRNRRRRGPCGLDALQSPASTSCVGRFRVRHRGFHHMVGGSVDVVPSLSGCHRGGCPTQPHGSRMRASVQLLQVLLSTSAVVVGRRPRGGNCSRLLGRGVPEPA